MEIEYQPSDGIRQFAEGSNLRVDADKLGQLAPVIRQVGAHAASSWDVHDVDPAQVRISAATAGTVPTGNLDLAVLGSQHAVSPNGLYGPRDSQFIAEFALNDWATEQLGSTRLEIPVRYVRQLVKGKGKVEAQPRVFGNLANDLLRVKSAQDRRFLIRGSGDKVRAVLSNRYRIFDNHQILAPLINALSGRIDADHLEVDTFGISDTKFHLGLVFKDHRYTGNPSYGGEQGKHVRVEGLKPGDDFYGGIWFSNSEVGDGGTVIAPRLFRVTCSNGLVSEERVWDKRHQGSQWSTDFQAVIETELREGILAAIEATPQFIEAWIQKTSQVDEDPRTRLKAIGKVANLTQLQTQQLLFSLDQEFEATRGGVVNAITRAAQHQNLIEDRHQLESLGGYVLNLPEAQYESAYDADKVLVEVAR